MNKYLFFIISLFFLACKKQSNWLDKKSNKSDIVPVTLDDFKSLISNDNALNADYPGLGIIGSDNYYITYASWQGRQTIERNAYTWRPDVYAGGFCPDWEYAYKKVAYANVVLEGLDNIQPDMSSQQEYNIVKGSALFFRAYAFYDLAQLFAKPYDKNTAAGDPGIPLRIHADVNEHYPRASVEESYDRILADLQEATSLLPLTTDYRLLPPKQAALALLARVNLVMGNYEQAAAYADTALALTHDLIDFNSLDTTADLPFPDILSGNKEVLFYCAATSYGILASYILKTDTVLYSSYTPDDLRKAVFFRYKGPDNIVFKGDYTGQPYSLFSGLAVNELYLVRAECNARQNKVGEAMADLNTLLSKRWKAGTFVPYTATEAADALKQIIAERRKELPFTGDLRWEDLRRLNQEPVFAKTLVRLLNGETFSLPPNDKRYVYPLPDIETGLGGLEQNSR